ncbi:CMGC kinase, CK2 family, putative [Eimeria necatrix]|uniref:non-specific serine/threonine protein kinase n=1 Tax=Eimeria necatrix TaxID=51315 RepID=U6MKY1_9EIME|nr:CMGC kinase, CK2 family, putative [Eimeria necatrix]CDJ64661.1 CMGC kinase, CK2 family, putative [Eimeria necatrix]
MERIGEYEIVSVVGSGSFGKAVLVKDRAGRKLIMKLINTRQMNKEDIEEAKREIQVLSKLVDAPFIVHYRNAFNDTYHGNPHLCIVMDFCEGGDMAKLIRERKRQRKPFSEITLRTWLLQLAVALDFMHKHKILHRGN